jgi:hypothetical protein
MLRNPYLEYGKQYAMVWFSAKHSSKYLSGTEMLLK